MASHSDQDHQPFLQTSLGRGLVITGFIAAVAVAGYAIYSNVGASSAALSSSERWFICSETGKSFTYKLKIGDSEPVLSPFSGKNTGFECEYCYWTKDGKPKQEPTLVLLNSKKGGREPTFCTDCGRLVVPLNPPASDAATPPPTEEQYKSRRNSGPGNATPKEQP